MVANKSATTEDDVIVATMVTDDIPVAEAVVVTIDEAIPEAEAIPHEPTSLLRSEPTSRPVPPFPGKMTRPISIIVACTILFVVVLTTFILELFCCVFGLFVMAFDSAANVFEVAFPPLFLLFKLLGGIFGLVLSILQSVGKMVERILSSVTTTICRMTGDPTDWKTYFDGVCDHLRSKMQRIYESESSEEHTS